MKPTKPKFKIKMKKNYQDYVIKDGKFIVILKMLSRLKIPGHLKNK